MSLTAYNSVSDPVGLGAVQDPDPVFYVIADPGLAITGKVKYFHFFLAIFQNFDLSFL
jgi:hypothetical protein